MTKITVTQTFDSDEDNQEIRMFMMAPEYHSVLWEIDQEIRNKLKYCDDEWLQCEGSHVFLERLREMVWGSGVFRDG